MPGTSRRRSPLPPDWYIKSGRRQTVLERDDYRCRLQFPGCEGEANEVHHTGEHDDHRLNMLVAACSRCHQHQTSSDAGKARAKKYREMRFRKPEQHPGLIDPR